ncbi:Pseudouridine synthase [Macleaya cordata]|uniref:Pseudouridine synthase n=1 Tax=Macleaya cordata TaxID=56857 RepID=A0A200PV09_MACCD|nr:Pseudouridine synthase [Macleaya cordata]
MAEMVRRESVNSTSAANLGTQAQECRLRRVSAKDAMNSGDRILLPVSVQELRTEKQESKCSDLPSEKQEYKCNDDELTYMHSLELYKDPSIIVVNKPPGMPVQGGIGIKKSLDVLASTYLRYDYSEPPRLVHRLDRDSSGVLVMGRTQTSATILHSIFREKTFDASSNDTNNTKRLLQRKYWALVIGTPRRASGLISAPLGKVILDNGKSERITVVNDTKNMSSQHAVTEYRLIQSPIQGLTWIELCPLTGRKHQLRVHCAEVLGTPIVGDYKYGWQAHRKWKHVPWSKFESRLTEKLPNWKMLPFILDLESGSISEKQPHLHLHCRQMILPDVHLALQHVHSASDVDLSELESLDFVAPLPSHMQRSWDILNS